MGTEFQFGKMKKNFGDGCDAGSTAGACSGCHWIVHLKR